MPIHRGSMALCLSLFAFCSRSYARKLPQGSCDIPVVVTHFDNALVEDLGPKEFQVQVDGIQGMVEVASIDSGPKRIALMIDASRNIPDDEWILETQMAYKFVDHARPGDTFSFIVVGVDTVPSTMSDVRSIKDQLRKLMSSRPPVSDLSEPIYDALLASAKRLNPPEFADTLFLFGHHEDFGSRADADQVLDLILKNKLRFFGMSYADPLQGKLPPGFDPNKPLPPSLGPNKLEKMSNATGNYFSFHSVQVLNHTGQFQLYEGFLGDLYARIAKPYRLRLAVPAVQGQIKLEISVSNLQERKIRTSGIYYPHIIYSCTSLPASNF